MKIPFTLILLFVYYGTSLNAQNWGSEGTRWTYAYYNLSYAGFSEITFEKDTMIYDRTVQKFNRRIQYRHLVLGTNHEFQLPPSFMFENEGIVYLLVENDFDTLYNFNAQVGEKWDIKWVHRDQDIVTQVLKVGFKEINGQRLPWQLVRRLYPDHPEFSYQDTIVAGIGSIEHYLFPWDYFAGQTDMNEGGIFRCYENLRFGSYGSPYFDEPCDFKTATSEVYDWIKVEIFPMPFTNLLQLTFPTSIPKEAEIVIQSVEGHILKRLPIPFGAKRMELPLFDLQRGFYLLAIIQKGNLLHVSKLLKI